MVFRTSRAIKKYILEESDLPEEYFTVVCRSRYRAVIIFVSRFGKLDELIIANKKVTSITKKEVDEAIRKVRLFIQGIPDARG